MSRHRRHVRPRTLRRWASAAFTAGIVVGLALYSPRDLGGELLCALLGGAAAGVLLLAAEYQQQRELERATERRAWRAYQWERNVRRNGGPVS